MLEMHTEKILVAVINKRMKKFLKPHGGGEHATALFLYCFITPGVSSKSLSGT